MNAREREVMVERAAQMIAHRACCGSEHDPSQGKFHGFCVVCGVPWPCEYAGKPALIADTRAGEGVEEADERKTMDGALCDFAKRWRLDGDYLRCVDCGRPQLASYANLAFPHASDCKHGVTEMKPWLMLTHLLRPLHPQPAQGGQGQQEPVAWLNSSGEVITNYEKQSAIALAGVNDSFDGEAKDAAEYKIPLVICESAQSQTPPKEQDTP